MAENVQVFVFLPFLPPHLPPIPPKPPLTPPSTHAPRPGSVVRMRPKAASERLQPSVVSISSDNQVTVEQPTNVLEKMGIANKAALSRSFTYDKAFGEATSQEQLFAATVAPVVDEVMKGFSCTVFAYGQTGTGKSYTMEGPKRSDGSIDTEGPGAGIIPRAIKRVFAALPVSERGKGGGGGGGRGCRKFPHAHMARTRAPSCPKLTQPPPHPPTPTSHPTPPPHAGKGRGGLRLGGEGVLPRDLQ